MYEAMHKHWKSFGPPVYVSVAAYLGLTKKRKATAADIQQKYVGPGGFIH